MNNEQINIITKTIFSYLITFIQTSVITPVVFLFFARFLIIIIVIQDNISLELSSNILKTIFLGQESINESHLVGFYFIYASIFSIIFESMIKIFKKGAYFKLKYKLITSTLYFLSVYILGMVLLSKFEHIDLFVIIFLLLFSLLFSLISISICHALGILRNKLTNIYNP
jgi:hypothetical protein